MKERFNEFFILAVAFSVAAWFFLATIGASSMMVHFNILGLALVSGTLLSLTVVAHSAIPKPSKYVPDSPKTPTIDEAEQVGPSFTPSFTQKKQKGSCSRAPQRTDRMDDVERLAGKATAPRRAHPQ